MTLFPTAAQLYRLIQRELPRDVYPDAGDPAKYLSTAESWSEATVWANTYAAAQTMRDNYFPQTADINAIALHEMARFGYITTGLSLSDRQTRLLNVIRAEPSMSLPDLATLVQSFLPAGTIVQLVNWGNQYGGWLLGESELGNETFLGGYGASFYPIGTDLWAQDGSGVGLSPTQWSELKQAAYTYEVRIYNYTPDAPTLAAIDNALTKAEPSMATHSILTNQSLANYVRPHIPVMEEL